MALVVSLLIFALGTMVGSFLNVLILRTGTKEDIIKKPSHCPHCLRPLKWFELIPIFSFLILKGRCASCQKKLSIQYPLVELATGILFLFIFLKFSSSLSTTIFYFLIGSILIVIFAYDLKHKLIPNRFLYPAILISLIFGFSQTLWFRHLAAGAIAFLFFWFLILITGGRGMGLGDAKFGFLMGLILGWPLIVAALIFAFFAGALMATALMIFKKKTLKSEIPFGPFLVLGTFLTIFWGQTLFEGYLQWLGL